MHMTIIAYPKPRRRPAKVATPVALAHIAPPSGALLNAILSYADIADDIGGGLSILRVSADRMNDPVITKLLGREAARLADVSILWNDDQSEIQHIFDAAIPTGVENFWSEPQFELTEVALAYIEDDRRHGDLAAVG
jgi:hypothetical protein